VVALIFGHLVDALRVVSNSVHALPARDRVGPDDRMDSLEVCPDILRSAALGAVQLEPVSLSAVVEDGLCVGGSQSFQELLVCWRQTVVYFITRRPQSVSAGLRELSEPQDGVVTRHWLKGNVAVPSILVALPFLTAETLCIQLLSLLRADNRDFIVFAAERSTAVGDRVDVEFRSGRLARELAQALSKLLLQIIVEAVLFAEEDNSALRDCAMSVPVCVPPSARASSEARMTRDESLSDGVSRDTL